jgi:hypothetical protein
MTRKKITHGTGQCTRLWLEVHRFAGLARAIVVEAVLRDRA